MQKRNVTIQLPADLLREARHVAIDRGESLSTYVSQLLRQAIQRDHIHSVARERQVELMEHGVNLGTSGNIAWSRDDLHEG